jgi:hypothetical protein
VRGRSRGRMYGRDLEQRPLRVPRVASGVNGRQMEEGGSPQWWTEVRCPGLCFAKRAVAANGTQQKDLVDHCHRMTPGVGRSRR